MGERGFAAKLNIQIIFENICKNEYSFSSGVLFA